MMKSHYTQYSTLTYGKIPMILAILIAFITLRWFLEVKPERRPGKILPSGDVKRRKTSVLW